MSMHISSSKLACMKPMSCHEQDHPELAAAASNTGFDWLDDSISFLTGDVDIAGWWSNTPSAAAAAQQDDIASVVAQTLSPPPPPLPTTSSPLAHASPSIASPAASSPSEPSSSNKKRKSPAHRTSVGHSSSSNQRRRGDHGGGGKKGGGSKGGGGDGAGSDRDTRWAEQLLNPCAAAVESGNLTRAQHLFYVLSELASFSGDANHRLAAHGLAALARRLLPAAVGAAAASSVRVPPCECPTPAFAAAEPRLFRASLIKFHEVSPWFALPNALANAAIARLVVSGGGAPQPPLHVVDLGVSHGVQWPTLLESLTRLPGGRAPPPSVRLTVVGPTTTTAAPPFSVAPPGYDFSPHLLRYAKSINLQLGITRAASLESARGLAAAGEVLVVCLQFRLGHAGADERTEILRKVRGLNPELVVLSELDSGGSGGGGTAAGEFTARLEMLWRFLESTAAAFKGRDGEERRLMEAEAGTSMAAAVAAGDAATEGREAWRERMVVAGFEEAAFGEEAVETAKSLLRKYDGGWEMAAAPSPAAGVVALRWKGQPVSFCSLWRPASSG